jgi:uncharacterized protein YgbK (DUF1537 family)
VSELARRGLHLVVLDDDPTGIQTVHGCLLVTRWNRATLRTALHDEVPVFYALTNSRAYPPEQVRRTITRIVLRLLALNGGAEQGLLFLSRSDSTLRSHFPVEIDSIAAALKRRGAEPPDAVFLCPAFFEAGRITRDDTHYLLEGGHLVPTAETEFARDSVFGYSSSLLPRYIEEKTGGRVRASQVLSIPLAWLRSPQAEGSRLPEFLSRLQGCRFVVVNAESYHDLEALAGSLLAAAAAGKRFLFQSAASLVRALAGLPERPLLGAEILKGAAPGLFVVGSHVQKTTRQLELLLAEPGTEAVPLEVAQILRRPSALAARALRQIDAAVKRGRTPVAFTSRQELTFPSKALRLQAGQRISEFLARLVRRLPYGPSYLVAKGGITSHVVLVRGLRVSRARVLGQVLPGVPAILTPPGGRLGGLPYIIFPGNVGGEDALRAVYQSFSTGQRNG